MKIISWKNYSKAKLIDNLRMSNWKLYETMNVEDKLNCIRENLLKSVKKITNVIDKKNRINVKKWFDSELKNLKQKKIEKYNIWAADKKNVKAFEEYKEKRNDYCKTLKYKKNMYNRQQIIYASNDQKKMWNCLRNMTKKKSNNQVINEVLFDDVPVEGEQKICDKFNSFFIESIININQQIPKNDNIVHNINQEIPNANCKFKFKEIDVQTVCDTAKKLSKKANKSEFLNSNVWFDSMEYIGYHFTQLVNQSLREGTTYLSVGKCLQLYQFQK